MSDARGRPSPCPLIASFDVRAVGDGLNVARNGFSHPEDTHIWALYPNARLVLPVARYHPRLVVVFHVKPFVHQDTVTSQRVQIVVNGRSVFHDDIVDEIAVGFPLSLGRRVSQLDIEILFSYSPPPEAVGLPQETRHLALMLKGIWLFDGLNAPALPENARDAGAPAPTAESSSTSYGNAWAASAGELLSRFESLGHSCDFGLAQREAGIEPLGLLRFSGITTGKLFRGLMDEFCHLGRRQSIHPYIPNESGEFWIYEDHYDLRYHTFIPPDRASPDQLIAREMSRLPFLRRKLIEDLNLGEKIFLLKRPDTMSDFEALAIWVGINQYGENILLFIKDVAGDAGTVDAIGKGLFRGYVNTALDDSEMVFRAWLDVCANALALRHGMETV